MRTNKNSKIKLNDSLLAYIREYLLKNNKRLFVDEEILDEIIYNSGAEDGRLALLEEEDIEIDKDFAERGAIFIAEIFDEMEKGDIDFEDLNSRLK